MPSADHRVALPEGDRQYHIGLAQASWPSTSSSPATRIAPPASRPASTASSSSAVTASSHRSPAPTRASACRCVSTGIGTDNVEIVVAEILAITERPTFIRDRVLRGAPAGDRARATWSSPPAPSASRPRRATSSTTATRPSRTTRRSSRSSRRPRRLGHRHHVGITATAPGFFGAQGRPIPQLPIRYPDLADEMARQRVLNFEMEASALLVLAGLGRLPGRRRVRRVRAAGDRRIRGRRGKDRRKPRRGDGARGLRILAEMDRQKRCGRGGALAPVALEDLTHGRQ